MADKIFVYKSELSDVWELAPNLRKGDLAELDVLNITPEKSLLRGYIFSEECFTARFRGEIVGMFGYTEIGMPSSSAAIWFLGTDEMVHHGLTFVKDGRKYIQRFLDKYSKLSNAVYEKNTAHIEWLKRMGMVMSDCIYINGHRFIKFYKERKNV